MGFARLGRHLVANRWRVRNAFPRGAMKRIEMAVAASEKRHGGQIRIVIEGALEGRALFRQQSARARALDVFAQVRVWDTEHNNGVLIYLLLADRKVEIVADRGIDALVGKQGWADISDVMRRAFRDGRFEDGLLAGIAAVSEQLAAHFPHRENDRNELPDAPTIL